jgi:hypothetical protein
VTFTVDVASADLLLEAELTRLAEPLPADGMGRRYRITPATARSIAEQGLAVSDLEQWALNRSGEPLSASARLLLLGSDGPPAEIRQRLVLTLPSEAITDGVCQWPETASLLDGRLGPCAVIVSEDGVDELLGRLTELGVATKRET